MTRKHELDPPAFPGTQEHVDSGMTLRDWFAGQALLFVTIEQADNSKDVAQLAYRIADAMLKERDK